MANFQGTIQEFHHFFGPRIRNAINGLTRKFRTQRNQICNDCGEKRELHSAHVHGQERRSIIEKILTSYVVNGVIDCEIVTIEKKILEAHEPIEDTFTFLCHPCHIKYDGHVDIKPLVNQLQLNSLASDFTKLHRIKLWVRRNCQVNFKIITAFLELEKNGTVRLEDLERKFTTSNLQYGAKKFKQNYASMKTDSGNSHGKVFYDENGIVSIWPRVREEIDIHFESCL